MDAIKAIKERRSVREFADTPIPHDVIMEIIDCGRLAASGRNLQPWKFVAVTDADLKNEIARVAVNGKFIKDAPMCILIFCLKDAKRKIEDGAAATQNMLVGAKALGVSSCWIAGANTPYENEVAELVGAPEEYTIISLIALGYAKNDEIKTPLKKDFVDIFVSNRF